MAVCCGCERSQWAFILGCCICGFLVISLIIFVVSLILIVVVAKPALENNMGGGAGGGMGGGAPPMGGGAGGPHGRSDIVKTATTVICVIIGIAIFFTIVEIGFSVILILGAKRCSRCMLTAWFWAGIVFTVFHAIFSFGSNFGVGGDSWTFMSTGIILVVLYICALIVVWPLRDECEAPGGGAGGQSVARTAPASNKPSTKSTGKNTVRK